MITVKEDVFHLETKNTSYIIHQTDGRLEQLHYGKRVSSFSVLPHTMRFQSNVSCAIQLEDGSSLEYRLLEHSTSGKGDYRSPSLSCLFEDYSNVMSFQYASYEIKDLEIELPSIKSEALFIYLEDAFRGLRLSLIYQTVDELDVILRSTRLENIGSEVVTIESIASFQLDLFDEPMSLSTFNGTWIEERMHQQEEVVVGIKQFGSTRGVSSANHNPGFFLEKRDKSCFGFNFMYSGDFLAHLEKSTNGNLRVMLGIHPQDFSWSLNPGESFQTPVATLSYAKDANQLSHNFHRFVNEQLIPEHWRFKDRPIVFNTWEAMYFDFNESKLLKFARAGKKLGLECLVLDDGWFLGRNDDTTSLGDWVEDPKKLPNGLERLVEKVHQMDLKFGLWVEPEMISVKSKLYEKHPEWAMQHPGYEMGFGRNQLVLDLSNDLVVDYLFETLSDLIERTKLDYIKWDMNRPIGDVYSRKFRSCEVKHRYVLGLYRLLDRLTKKYPQVLFESCASGGSRFDYGMLHYTPQIWTSDNTDVLSRMKIQYGTSFFYPPSTMGTHVGADPNHQLLRRNPIENRFNIACFGAFGYELNLLRLPSFDQKVIKEQVRFYKEHRTLLTYGDFRRIQSPFDSNRCVFSVGDRGSVLLFYGQLTSEPHPSFDRVKIEVGEGFYRVVNRKQYFNIESFGELVNEVSPIPLRTTGAYGLIHKTISEHYLFESEVMDFMMTGSELATMGFVLNQTFIGTGYTDQVRYMGDFGSRLFLVKRENNNGNDEE